MSFPSIHISFELVILIATILSTFVLAVFVFINNSKSATNRIFSLLSLVIISWLIVAYISFLPSFVTSSLIWIRLSVVFAAPMASLLFLLAKTVPSSKSVLKPRTLFLIIFVTILIMVLNISPLTFSNLEIVNNSPNPVPGPGIIPFALFSIVFSSLSVYTLINKFTKSTGTIKEQVRFIMFGMLLMLLLIIATILVPVSVFKVNIFVPFAPLYTLIFLGMTTYAIVRHRLLDIRAVVARTIAFGALAIVLFIFYVVISIGATTIFLKTSINLQQTLVFGLLTIVIGYTFQPLRQIFTRVTDNIFFKEDYDSNIFLSNLTKVMAEAILIDDIAHRLLQKIISEMRITRGAFVLTDGGKIFVSETQGYKDEPTFSEKDIFSIQALDKDLIFEDLEEGSAKELMRKLNVTVVIPLKTQVDHVGVMLLGEKASGEIYSQKDIKVLEIFAPEASISFENSKSVEKIRRFNITLKEQVERATKELRSANEQLKDLDKLKDEFLSIASHDLRTPMTAIKGYLWMAINGRAGKLQNDQLKRYLEISYSSAERMIQLINDLLNVSRIKAGRMQMVFENLELKPIMDQVFAEIMSKATEKSIDLTYKEEGKIPTVIIDKQRIPEVLQNLIGNALKFTPEKGKITVTAKAATEKGFIAISVTDTGVGLSKEDAGKLFEKFGRMEHSYSAAKTTGGTGLGLYITKNYVDMLGGKIWVDSTPGKGTTFTFTIREYSKEMFDQMVKDPLKNPGSTTVPQPNTSMAVEATRTSIPVR